MFWEGFEKGAGKFEQLVKMLPKNPIGKFFARRKLSELHTEAIRQAFKNPSKASQQIARAEAYAKAAK